MLQFMATFFIMTGIILTPIHVQYFFNSVLKSWYFVIFFFSLLTIIVSNGHANLLLVKCCSFKLVIEVRWSVWRLISQSILLWFDSRTGVWHGFTTDTRIDAKNARELPEQPYYVSSRYSISLEAS